MIKKRTDSQEVCLTLGVCLIFYDPNVKTQGYHIYYQSSV